MRQCPQCGTVIPAQEPSGQATAAGSETPSADNVSKNDPATETSSRDSKPKDESFSFACPICNTLLYASPNQLKQQMRCPDCHSYSTVPPPPPPKTKITRLPTEGDEDEFQLSDPIDRPTISTPLSADILATEQLIKSPQNHSQKRDRDPHDSPQTAVTREATVHSPEDEDKREPARPPLPEHPFDERIFVFFSGAALIVQLVILAILIAIVRTLPVMSNNLISGLIATIFTGLLGAIAFVLGSVIVLRILQETSDGQDQIGGLPDLHLLEWIPESLYVLNALFLSILPGYVVGPLLNLIHVSSLPPWIFPAASLLILFPIVLLSMLDVGSPVIPLSTTVRRSLSELGSYWVSFYLRTGLLILAVFVIFHYRFESESFPNNFIAALLITGFCALGARYLGRMTWCISELVKMDDDTETDAL